MIKTVNNQGRLFVDLIVGLVAVAIILAAISVVGYYGEPYFQWVPSVMEVRMQAQFSNSALYLLIGLLILTVCFTTVFGLLLSFLALYQVRIFGSQLLFFIHSRAKS